MIKIYFEKGFVEIRSQAPSLPEKSALIIEDRSMDEIADLLVQYQQNRLNLIAYLIHPEPELILKKQYPQLELIRAAGGIIENSEGQVLFIYRRRHWDLPKGKIEKGESTENACLRELREECGLENLNLNGYLCTTYHTYRQANTLILKETVWYKVLHSGIETPTPQWEEDITDIAWFEPNSLNEVNANTFPSIQAVINHYLNEQKCQ